MKGSFFILGNPRSGTSLFRSLLNSHPDVVVPPECGFALWLRSGWENVDWSDIDVRRSFADAVQGCRKFETWQITTGELFAALNGRVVSGYPDAVSCIYEAYAQKRGKYIRMWGDKNNYYMNHAPELRSLFPSARFLHLVRDVRDVACSYQELAAKEIDSKYRPELSIEPSVIAEEWRINNQQVLQALEDSTVYHRIRYEDLVTDVDGTLKEVMNWLGLDDRGAIASDMHLAEMDEPVEFLQWKSKLAGPVDGSSVGRYVRDLPMGSRRAIEGICKPMLRKFGYSVED